MSEHGRHERSSQRLVRRSRRLQQERGAAADSSAQMAPGGVYSLPREPSAPAGGMIKLGESTYVDAARLARDPRSVILRPLGAVDEHGTHLPLRVAWLGT